MQTVYDNASKIQMRMMAWMREPEWTWHIVHTDHMADRAPRSGLNSMSAWFGKHRMNMGCPVFDNRPNGPND